MAADNKRIRIVPLGGCGEIGMNMTVIEYGDEMIAVDCGHTSPEEDMPGVDLVLPDPGYLVEHLDRLQGILITHGHEDHIGAVPHLLPRLQVPVFGTRLPVSLLRAKMVEYDYDFEPSLVEVNQREPLRLGSFEIEWVNVTHSIPDASALIIRTPLGVIVHTGDYKIDDAPVVGELFDFYSLAKAGEGGVLAMLADSTNVERVGTTDSESAVIEPIEKHFQETEGTLIIGCFSSALHRVQVILDLADKYDRKVFLAGLNMERNTKIALELDFLYAEPGVLRPLSEFKSTPRDRRIVLTTGSQGEPLAGLMRMSLDSHKKVSVMPGDTVLLSARIIPGNERSIFRMVNHLFRRGAHVVYDGLEPIHASGHAYRDEMKLMLNLLQPKFLIPVHGEIRHLLAHREMAVDLQLPEEDVFVLENGMVLEIEDEERASILEERVEASRILVDGIIEDVHEVVLRDRKHLSEDGMILVLMTIDRKTGKLLAEPEIISRGFIYMDESEELIAEIKRVVLATFDETELESREEYTVVQDAVRRALRKYLKKETQRFPVILPVVSEV